MTADTGAASVADQAGGEIRPADGTFPIFQNFEIGVSPEGQLGDFVHPHFPSVISISIRSFNQQEALVLPLFSY
jgi:hypothetical protein